MLKEDAVPSVIVSRLKYVSELNNAIYLNYFLFKSALRKYIHALTNYNLKMD